MVAVERWLWVREMVAAEVVVGERDGGGDDSGVGEMREREREEKILGEMVFTFQIRTRGSEHAGLKKLREIFCGEDKVRNGVVLEIYLLLF
jgi:hypothetical protein